MSDVLIDEMEARMLALVAKLKAKAAPSPWTFPATSTTAAQGLPTYWSTKHVSALYDAGREPLSPTCRRPRFHRAGCAIVVKESD